MDPLTIGRQIKAKYPQYAQYPDEMIGHRWIEVHQKKSIGTGMAVNPYTYLGGQQTGQSAQTTPQQPSKSLIDLRTPVKQTAGDIINAAKPSKGSKNTMGMMGAGNALGAPQLKSGGNNDWIGSKIASWFPHPEAIKPIKF